MKKILTDAAVVGRAFGRALNWRFDLAHPDWAYYLDSKWGDMLFQGGALFETPPPPFQNGMFKPYPATGARTLNVRTAFYYACTLDSPAMIMRIPGVASQYLMNFQDANGDTISRLSIIVPSGFSGETVGCFLRLRTVGKTYNFL